MFTEMEIRDIIELYSQFELPCIVVLLTQSHRTRFDCCQSIKWPLSAPFSVCRLPLHYLLVAWKEAINQFKCSGFSSSPRTWCSSGWPGLLSNFDWGKLSISIKNKNLGIFRKKSCLLWNSIAQEISH